MNSTAQAQDILEKIMKDIATIKKEAKKVPILEDEIEESATEMTRLAALIALYRNDLSGGAQEEQKEIGQRTEKEMQNLKTEMEKFRDTISSKTTPNSQAACKDACEQLNSLSSLSFNK